VAQERLKNLWCPSAHLHIKHVKRGLQLYLPVGEGDVDWRGQLGALFREGSDGYYSIGTNHGPRVSASQACRESLRNMLLETT